MKAKKARYESPADTPEWRWHSFTVLVGKDGRLYGEILEPGRWTPEQYAEVSGFVLVGLEEG